MREGREGRQDAELNGERNINNHKTYTELDEAELDKRSKEKKERQHGKQKGRIKERQETERRKVKRGGEE